jgi:hypothetical protein
MVITLKKGSQVTIPMPAGWTVTSQNTNVVAVGQTGGMVTLTAGTSAGDSWISVQVASDLKASILVHVA